MENTIQLDKNAIYNIQGLNCDEIKQFSKATGLNQISLHKSSDIEVVWYVDEWYMNYCRFHIVGGYRVKAKTLFNQ